MKRSNNKVNRRLKIGFWVIALLWLIALVGCAPSKEKHKKIREIITKQCWVEERDFDTLVIVCPDGSEYEVDPKTVVTEVVTIVEVEKLVEVPVVVEVIKEVNVCKKQCQKNHRKCEH